jgi:hypothetical protein
MSFPPCRVAVLLFVAAAAGCSRGPQFCEVKGKVVLDGKPVPGGKVIVSDGLGVESGYADLNIDGEFAIRRSPAGPVVVVVRTEAVKAMPDERTVKALQAKKIPIALPDPKVVGNKYVAISSKYGDRGSTDLKFDLKPDAVNDITVELHK